MPSSGERVKALLAGSALAPTVLEVEDVSDGCGAKFEVVVVSANFEVRAAKPSRAPAVLESGARRRAHATPPRTAAARARLSAGQEASRAASGCARGARRGDGRNPRSRAEDVDARAARRQDAARCLKARTARCAFARAPHAARSARAVPALVYIALRQRTAGPRALDARRVRARTRRCGRGGALRLARRALRCGAAARSAAFGPGRFSRVCATAHGQRLAARARRWPRRSTRRRRA